MKTFFVIVIVLILTSIGLQSHRTCCTHVDTVIMEADSMMIHSKELRDSLDGEMRDIPHEK
jgi:hypothetical protein